MAIIYPDRPRIPAPVNPLAQGLSGLMEGWESGRKTLKDNQAIDAAYGVYQNAPGQKPLDLSALGGIGGGFSAGGVASSAGAAAGQTVGGSTPSTKLAGDSSKIYGDFIGTVKAGDPSLGLAGVTNPYGLAAVASTGKAESGYSPGNIHRQWSDPSESGKAGTAGGVMSWRAERLQNMRSFASKVGDNPNAPSAATQAKFFLAEDPSLVAKLNAARSPEEAQQLMNRAWAFAGYDRPGGEAGRRIAMARSYAAEFGRGGGAQQAIEAIAPQAAAPQAAAPVQVASNDPQAGMASALAYSPTGPSAEAGMRVPTPTARPGQTAPVPTPRPEDQTYTMASATAPGNAPAAAPAGGGMDIGRIVSSVTQGQTNGANLTREQFAAMMQSDATKPLAMALFQSKVTGDPRAGERALELALRLENMQYERGIDQQRFGLQQEQIGYQRSRDQITDDRWQQDYDLRSQVANQKTTGFRTLNSEEAQQRGLPAGQYQVGPDNRVYPIKDGSGQTINVNTDGGTNGALLKKGNEELGKGLADTVVAGRNARRSLQQIGQLDSLLQQAGSGLGTVAKTYLGRVGINTQGLNEAQAAEALINNLIPSQRPPGSGTMSDADIVMFRQSIPSLMNQPGGNKLIMDTMRSIATYDAQIGDIAARVLRGELSQQDGDNMMATVENPLAGMAQQAPAASAAPAPSSQRVDENGVPLGGAAPASGGIAVGTTATNPQTGSKIRWTGQIWENAQ